jgi:hypothetical protein
LNEQQFDTPGPRREVAPSEARAIICVPTYQTGQALIAMLQDARQTRTIPVGAHVVRVFAPSCRSSLIARSAEYPSMITQSGYCGQNISAASAHQDHCTIARVRAISLRRVDVGPGVRALREGGKQCR